MEREGKGERGRGKREEEEEEAEAEALRPDVGSLARLTKRQTFPIAPFCSKSALKNCAVSMFTCGNPIAPHSAP